ncbi:hypothetical protein GPL21_16105 [Bradyrhizobium pachyrhizi]|uniref:Uncharacterized protein n=1 Tax=Bradyrhizobium pachyrhizi TaxID=280333 RepID=A0A844SUT6_9BRAD|nr:MULTISPECIES: hypothetical protein [Bradyrhizobium]MVT66621.1 hypothetical protein [Bradyrhizobium pachyrhizi]WOH82866.1 hypothetical protein RX327_06820 [Bradyrhizobium sp. BEA-2-5]
MRLRRLSTRIANAAFGRDRAVLALRHYPKFSARLKQALGKATPSREED